MRYPQTQKPPLGSQINWAHPLAKGLVGCWLFNERSGLYVSDLSGNNNRGTLVNHTHFEPGRSGPALSFDGTDDYVTIPDSSSFNAVTGSITISSWIKRDVLGNRDGIINRYNYATNQRSWALYIEDADNKIKWNVQENQTSYNSANLHSSIATLSANQWYHIVVTFIPSISKSFYINGVLDSTYTIGIASDLEIPAIPICIGINDQGDPGTSEFDGIIDEVRIYNRALSSQEIWQLYSKPYAMFERRPVWMDYVAAAEGRTTKNTDAWNLGQGHGMSFRMVRH